MDRLLLIQTLKRFEAQSAAIADFARTMMREAKDKDENDFGMVLLRSARGVFAACNRRRASLEHPETR